MEICFKFELVGTFVNTTFFLKKIKFINLSDEILTNLGHFLLRQQHQIIIVLLEFPLEFQGSSTYDYASK